MLSKSVRDAILENAKIIQRELRQSAMPEAGGLAVALIVNAGMQTVSDVGPALNRIADSLDALASATQSMADTAARMNE